MKTIKWCNLNNGCVMGNAEPTEDFCSTNWLRKENTCEHYNPKLNFFEAWEKAEDGDVLKYCVGHPGEVKKLEEYQGLFWLSCGNTVPPRLLFEKEWTIIPKKKTVTVDIPKGAKNIAGICRNGLKTNCCGIEKITYELDQ